MHTFINIEGTKVRLEANGLFPVKYKKITGRDVFKDIKKLDSAPAQEIEQLPEYLDFLYDIVYVLAWFADRSIPADRDEWLLGFNNFDVYTIIENQQVIDLVTESLKPKKPAKKNNRPQTKKK